MSAVHHPETDTALVLNRVMNLRQRRLFGSEHVIEETH